MKAIVIYKRNTGFTEKYAKWIAEARKTTGTFFMQGGLDYSHMGAIDKAMMRMMCAVMKKQKGADSEEYKTISQSFDATDKNAIAPLIEYIKGE